MMNDKKLQKLMDDTFNACVKHVTLLRQLEDEYKRRFGHYPADVDDDWFIDSFSYGSGGKTTVKIMTENALLHIETWKRFKSCHLIEMTADK